MELIPTIVYKLRLKTQFLQLTSCFLQKGFLVCRRPKDKATAPKVYIIPEVIWVEAIWNVDLTVLFRSHTIFQAMYNPTNSVRLGCYGRIKKVVFYLWGCIPKVIRRYVL